jgi:histidinol phosphatase-like PHP family hydrolase
VTLTNRQLAELLARAAESESGHRRDALRKAGRAAMFTWTEEAAEVAGAGRSLTDLRRVGPWVARAVHELLDDPPDEVPDPPPLRSGFLTRSEAWEILAGHGDWQEALRGDLQMHTTYSDGGATLREMVEAAGALGYEFVGITDHSKGLPIANGMDETRLAGQAEDVAALNEELERAGSPPRVLHSIEMNLSPEGEGDMEPDVLARLDLVLGTFHSKLRLKEDQTERYLAAVRNPTVHVLAHPRCRIYDRRVGLWCDWERVFEEAVRLGKAVEIDASPYRQDLDVDLLRLAGEAGVRISIGTDAHSVRELGYMEYGLAAAVAAGIPRERILNFRPVGEVLAWAAGVRDGSGPRAPHLGP